MSFYTDLFRKGWAAFRRGWKLVIGVTLLMLLPGTIQNILTRIGILGNEGAGILIAVVPGLIKILLLPGAVMIWLKLQRNEQAELRDLLGGLHYAGRYLLAILLLSVIVWGIVLGAALLSAVLTILLQVDRSQLSIVRPFMIVPLGIGLVWLLLMYGMLTETTVDQGVTGPVGILRRSREILRAYRWRYLGLLAILSVPVILGFLLFRSQHPAAFAISMVIVFAINILQNMLNCAFYEAVRPAGKTNAEPGDRP